MAKDKVSNPQQSITAAKVTDQVGGDIIETASGERGISAAAAHAQSMMMARVGLAYKNPRNTERSVEKMLERCNDPDFAAAAVYKKPMGGQDIEGLSIRFAEEAAIAWGNIYSTQMTTYEDRETRALRVTVMDLESNITHECDVTVDKTVERRDPTGRTIISSRKNKQGVTTYRVEATDDEVVNKVNNLCSKALRNLLLRVIPADAKKRCYVAAQKTKVEGIRKDPVAAWQRMLRDFLTLGVTQKDIETLLGKPAKDATPEDMAELRDWFTAIANGETTWAAIVAEKAPKAAPEHEESQTITEEEATALLELCKKAKVKLDDYKVHLGETYGALSAKGLDVSCLGDIKAWIARGGRDA